MHDSFQVKLTLTLSVRADQKTFCEKSMQENVQAALDIACANHTLTAEGIIIDNVVASNATITQNRETHTPVKFTIFVGDAYYLTELVCDNSIDRCVTDRDPDLAMVFDSEQEALELISEEPELQGAKVIPF
jgi:hypothetical protein